MTRTTLAAVAAVLALAAAACGDGQTGPDYRGEPLMSLKGVVTSTELALSGEQVPALLLGTPFDPAVDGARTIHFIQGDVEGMFPSSFTLRVYDAPPAGVAAQVLDGTPVIWGQLVAVASDHPAWLKKREFADPTESGAKLREQLCDTTGECIEGHPAECAELAEAQRTTWPCGPDYPDDLPWEVYGHSDKHVVAYFAQPAEAGSTWSKLLAGGASIAAGYHVVLREELSQALSPEDFMTNSLCMDMAAIRARDQVAEEHGIEVNELYAMGLNAEWQERTLLAYAEDGCISGSGMILDTVTEPVELPFTTWPTAFGF